MEEQAPGQARREDDEEVFRRYTIRLTKSELDQLQRILRRTDDIVVMVDDGAALRRAMNLLRQIIIWCGVIGGGIVGIKSIFFGPHP